MIPLHDLAWQYEQCKEAIDKEVSEVLSSCAYVGGEKVARLEREIAAYCGVSHAVGCNSGTDALMLILAALGVGEGDEVITTPYTFFATAEAIINVGATPVFVDIDSTYCIDPSKIEAAITSRTRAILPVHIFGRPCDMESILSIAHRHGLYVVEDACQAIGAKGICVGDAAAFSFYPTKNLGGAGDGGMVVTDDASLAARIRQLANHGTVGRYEHVESGINSRLDALQAAVLLAKLPHLDEWNAMRSETAQIYASALSLRPVTGVHHLFVLTSHLPPREALRARNVETGLFYPKPLHLMPCFSNQPRLPVAEFCAGHTFALPCFPGITQAQREQVIAALT